MLHTPRERPLGVTIIAILLGIQAVLAIIGGIIVLVAATFANPLAGLLVGWIPLAIGILSFVLAWGLWTLKPWAFWVTVVLEIVYILINVFSFTRPNGNAFSIFGGGIISLIILIYLLVDRHVRAAFSI
jgi:uncharacterized membrane protein (DUF2068 family)